MSTQQHDPANIARAQAFVDMVGGRIRIGAYVRVVATFASEDAAAEVSRNPTGFDMALAHNFFDGTYSPEEQRDIVLHEFGHVALWGYQEALQAVVKGKAARSLLDAREHEVIDRMVCIARDVVPVFPP